MLEALAAARTIVVHDQCSDGLASAILLHDALPSAAVRFVQYATEAHRALPAEPGMLFCDFSPPRERVREFVDAGAIVLDHHASARDVVAAFGDRGVFADEEREPGVSGAVLALRHVWVPLRGGDPLRPFAERFAALVGVRDTWHKASPLWAEARLLHVALSSVPRDAWLAMGLAGAAADWSRLTWLGETLAARDDDAVRQALAHAHRFITPGGLRVIAFDGLALTSDAAEAARPRADLIIGFAVEVEAGLQILRTSLRSNERLDVAALARRFGGGGHRRAAGFAVALAADDPHPFALLERLLAAAGT